MTIRPERDLGHGRDRQRRKLGALVFLVPADKVLWGLGLSMAAANASGSAIGVAVVARRGSGFVRRVFLAVVLGLVASLGWQLVAV